MGVCLPPVGATICDLDNSCPEGFNELFRVSKNQIIWGGNYFDLPPNRGFIIWDKMVYIPTMSQIEQAWVSEDRLPKLVKINNTDKDRMHLTQKPIDLYRWILQNYAKEGFKILDTHGGSFTNAIACDMEGFDLDDADSFKMFSKSKMSQLRTIVLEDDDSSSNPC